MAVITAKAFDEFHGRLQPTADQDAQITGRPKSVAKYLDNYFGKASDMALLGTRLIGSAGRKTIIRPVDDVDVLAQFDGSSAWNKYKDDSQAFLYRIRQALAGYRVETVGARGQAVRLFYESGPHADITPVFGIQGGGYFLPRGDGSWLTTDPDNSDAYLAERNRALGGNLLRFSRMLKQWNRAHSSRLKGFHLEVMGAGTFASLGIDSRENFQVFFGAAGGVLHSNDPAGCSGDLAEQLTSAQELAVLDSFAAALDRVDRARAAEARGDHKESIRLWRIVFGEEMFPAYG